MDCARSMLLMVALAAPAAAMTGDQAEVIYPQAVEAAAASVTAKANEAGHASVSLAGYGNVSLQLSVMTRSGGGEIHGHLDDLMIVQQGTATLITGGKLVDPQALPNGGAKGSGIQNGASQTIAPGDVVLIPAGVPHQLLIPSGTTYKALVAKIKEP